MRNEIRKKSTLTMRIYNFLVMQNEDVRSAYQGKIMENPETHEKHRILSWIRLIGLNIKYRVFHIHSNKSNLNTFQQDSSQKNNKPISSKGYTSYDGTESSIHNYPLTVHFIKQLLEYDVISFDIFDTLLFRPMENPKDIFWVLGEDYHMLGFKNIRQQAENEARKIRYSEYGDSEVTLEEIYQRVNYYTGIPVKEGVEKELKLERELLYPNPYIFEVFQMLREQKKRIIVVSDMYISEGILLKWLEEFGYIGIEEIFVSVNRKCSKSDGSLYQYVQNHLKFESIVHVDDNWNAVLKARETGWNSIHQKNINVLGRPYRTPNMSPMVGSAFAGIVNAHLHSGLTYSPLYEYGYTYGGLFILGYCCWIHEYAKSNNIDKILFLSRDGYLLKIVYDKLFHDIPATYFFFSRIAAARISIRSYQWLFLDSFVLKKAKNEKLPVGYYLDLMELTSLAGELKRYGLSTLDMVNESTGILNQFVEFLVDHNSDIAEIYKDEIAAAKEYVFTQIQDEKRVAVVDIGWRGSSALALQRFLEYECNSKCEVVGLMAASPYDANIGEMQSRRMASYMFSLDNNVGLLAAHERFKADNAIYEFFLTAKHGTLKKFKLDNNHRIQFIFENPDIENYPMIDEIQRGILDFVEEYIAHWSKYPYMFNIPGSDVAMNIQNIVKNKSYIQKLFKDFKYNMGVGGQTVPFSDILG